MKAFMNDSACLNTADGRINEYKGVTQRCRKKIKSLLPKK